MVFAWCALAGALASTAIGLFQQYAPEAIGRIAMRRMTPAIYANLGQPNHLAHQLALGLASLVYLSATRRLSVAGGVVLAMPMLFVAALTQSRSPWLYFAAFAILAGFHRRSPDPAVGRRLLIGSLWLVPGIAAAQMAAQLPFLQPASYTMLPIDRLFEVASGWSPRVAVWKEAWAMFASSPLLGVGFGQFAWRHFLQVSAAAGSVAPGLYDHAHNLFLQLLARARCVRRRCGAARGRRVDRGRTARGRIAGTLVGARRRRRGRHSQHVRISVLVRVFPRRGSPPRRLGRSAPTEVFTSCLPCTLHSRPSSSSGGQSLSGCISITPGLKG